MTALVWLTLVVVAAWSASRHWKLWDVAPERMSRPSALLSAKLVYMEKAFRIERPFPLVAKVDRVYRRPNGHLVLVELKTRETDSVFLSDIIQLSAQRMALRLQTGAAVDAHAFVSFQGHGGSGRLSSRRVQLLEEETLVELYQRRRALLTKQTSPTYARSDAMCLRCVQRSNCDRFNQGN